MPGKKNVLVSSITQVVVSIAILAAGVGLYMALRATRPQPATNEDPHLARRVEVMPALAVPVRRQWQGFGTAQAVDKASVPAEVTAVVADIPPHIRVGAAVEEGEVLVRLDDTDFVLQQEVTRERIGELDAQLSRLDLEEESWQRRLELAQQDTRLAEADFERAQAAYARRAAGQREVDQAKQRVVAAVTTEVAAREQFDAVAPRRAQVQALKRLGESQLRLATKNVERCVIRSPLTGFIESGDIEVGESLSPGQRVCQIVSLRWIEVPLRLPASARQAINIGDDVTLTTRGSTAQSWLGNVRRIAPTDDETTRTVSVFVDFEQDPDAPDRLTPGRFVVGTVISQHTELRYVVPRRSLLGDRLLVVEDRVVKSRPVEVAYHVEGEFTQLGVVADQWAVLAGELPEGALVVINAGPSLPDGLQVEPVIAAHGVTAAKLSAEIPR